MYLIPTTMVQISFKMFRNHLFKVLVVVSTEKDKDAADLEESNYTTEVSNLPFIISVIVRLVTKATQQPTTIWGFELQGCMLIKDTSKAEQTLIENDTLFENKSYLGLALCWSRACYRTEWYCGFQRWKVWWRWWSLERNLTFQFCQEFY